jgi:hypothetical protein
MQDSNRRKRNYELGMMNDEIKTTAFNYIGN